MECRDTKLLMEAYWDRHLPPEMVDHIDDHVQACPACRAEYAGVNALLASPEPVSVPAGLRGRILAAVEQLEMPVEPERRAVPAYRWWMDVVCRPWMGALAACMVFFLLGWFSHHMWNPQKDKEILIVRSSSPTPLTLAAWTQNLALPGPVGPLPAMAQAVALHRAMEPDLPAAFMRNRALDHAVQPTEAAPPIEEISRIVAGLSTLGA